MDALSRFDGVATPTKDVQAETHAADVSVSDAHGTPGYSVTRAVSRVVTKISVE